MFVSGRVPGEMQQQTFSQGATGRPPPPRIWEARPGWCVDVSPTYTSYRPRYTYYGTVRTLVHQSWDNRQHGPRLQGEENGCMPFGPSREMMKVVAPSVGFPAPPMPREHPTGLTLPQASPRPLMPTYATRLTHASLPMVFVFWVSTHVGRRLCCVQVLPCSIYTPYRSG